jgi:hypothetical protein
VSKQNKHIVVEKVGERLILDVSAIYKDANFWQNKDSTSKTHWRMLVDERTQFNKWCFQLKEGSH